MPAPTSRARGIQDATLRAFHIGYNPEDLHDDPAAWGISPPTDPPDGDAGRRRIWLPRGITFPWYIDDPPGPDPAIWRLNIRRPLSPAHIARGEPKYLGPRGFANTLFNAGALGPDPAHALPAVLVEGELDALTIVQAAGDLVAAVATGSTAGARCLQWIARLAQAPRILVAFDVDPLGPNGAPGAGDAASAWWLAALPRALRWRPLLHDVNSAPAPEDVRTWIQCGLRR